MTNPLKASQWAAGSWGEYFENMEQTEPEQYAFLRMKARKLTVRQALANLREAGMWPYPSPPTQE